MIPVTWDGAVPAFRWEADRLLRETLSILRLSQCVRGVVVRPMDRRYGDDAWIRWTHPLPTRVWLEVEAGAFLTPEGRRRARAARLPVSALPARRFSPRACLEMLLHEFMHLSDEVRHGLRADAVPGPLRQEFNEAWNAWIDGRIAREGWPGLGREGRRRFFLEVFGPVAGMAAASAAFRRLWRAERMDQEGLLAEVLAMRGEGRIQWSQR